VQPIIVVTDENEEVANPMSVNAQGWLYENFPWPNSPSGGGAPEGTIECITAGPFDPKTAGPGLLRLLARAADVPDFATLDATLRETQAKVRESFVRILGRAP